jgi:putative radical SAM enzyme (TIGR03279 family)
MKDTAKKILSVKENSIAWEMDIEAGDELLAINDEPVKDIFDYMFLTQDTYLELLIRKPSGEEWIIEIEKDEDEELGIEFEAGLMDDYKSCHNKCIFCFIDQMPPGMRETLYFKDDDSRLSFLQGNYVTLTNMSMEDLDRIIKYNMSPINISFQTMNPKLRCMMLNNRFAGDILEKVNKLADAGIEMNGQIVLCKGINDGKELEYSLEVMSGLYPALRSVSVVPVGLSKYRDGLYPLEPFEKEDAEEVLKLLEKWQKKMRRETGVNFVYASDEWYLLAGKEIPDEEYYDGYVQLENGVGMMRLLESEIDEYLESVKGSERETEVSVATGLLAGPFIGKMTEKVRRKFPNSKVNVYLIRNDFFGEKITVSGLVTGQDLMKQLKGKKLGSRLLLPVNMLRSGEEVFLDDYTVSDLEKYLEVSIRVVDSTGEAFVRAVTDDKELPINKRRQIYEQTDSCDSRQT